MCGTRKFGQPRRRYACGYSRSGFTRLFELLESAPEAPSLRFDFVTDTRGLDYVEEVRKMDASLGIDRKSLGSWLLLVGVLFSTLPV